MPDSIHLFGVRHHGPGSARSSLRALNELKPDCVLIEGPPDADDVLALAGHAQMTPPVAILVHEIERPAKAVYYPFATFSPEWQAIRWALAAAVPVRFMDLPQSHRMAVAEARARELFETLKAKAAAEANQSNGGKAAEGPSPDGEPEAADVPAPPAVDPDPLQGLARAAGFDDGERWWEHVVEHRRDEAVDIFAAIAEAMAELRRAPAAGEAAAAPRDPDEPYREAWMRRTIRAATKEKFDRIAVVCGAWHVPALDLDAYPKGADDELLKGLAKVKTAATWVPWTYDRLSIAGGYGAGVHSPGWYEHLWQRTDGILEGWMTRVARLLRERDIDCSSAHVIEAVRLAETLAAMRGRPLADLSDVADATRSVFCFDSDLPMKLIGRELLVGHRIGAVPDETPMVPLQQDLLRSQKRLRLKPEALEREMDLDLRNEMDRDRSVLLHRLRLLGIDWGTPARAAAAGKGTFRERWQLRWDPGFAVKLIEAGTLGTTIAAAAGAALAKLAGDTTDLSRLAAQLQDAMLADLGDAAAALVRQIEGVAALAGDVTLLMATLPPLASLVRYGNVRGTDEGLVRHIIDRIVPRVAAGLGGAVASLNDDAAAAMDSHLRRTHDALTLLDDAAHLQAWFDAMARVLPHGSVHGLVRGRAARLLLDGRRIDAAEVARLLGLTLSRGNDPAQAARWLEGFLRGSGLLLLHDEKLLGLIDGWVGQVPADAFQELLPLLRRTFATFPAPERRQIGQALRRGAASPSSISERDPLPRLDLERAKRPLPLLARILAPT